MFGGSWGILGLSLGGLRVILVSWEFWRYPGGFFWGSWGNLDRFLGELGGIMGGSWWILLGSRGAMEDLACR